jgi:hypothetical protein
MGRNSAYRRKSSELLAMYWDPEGHRTLIITQNGRWEGKASFEGGA